MTDLVRTNLQDVPPAQRAAVRAIKARELHDFACRIQDGLNLLHVYLGDGDLLDAKRAIDKACDRARRVGERHMHPEA